MRVPVPVAFPDTQFLVLIGIAILIVPPILLTVANLITSRRSKEEGQKKGTATAFISGLASGALLLLVVGSMAWALTPYLKGKEAFSDLKEHYGTNIVVPKSIVPVAQFKDDLTQIEPFPVTVYRIAGGSPEDCTVYIQDARYVMYCGDPLVEFESQ